MFEACLGTSAPLSNRNLATVYAGRRVQSALQKRRLERVHDEAAIRMVVGDNFTIVNNNFHGSIYDVTRNGVIPLGAACTEQPVTVIGCEFHDYIGAGLFIDNVAQYVVVDNSFDNVGGRDTVT